MGITPLTVLAFLADVGDVKRFKSLRKMNAYLGLVPRMKESGGKSRSGHINRESRKLTRTILTQSIHHVSNSSPYLRKFYCDLTDKRGSGFGMDQELIRARVKQELDVSGRGGT